MAFDYQSFKNEFPYFTMKNITKEDILYFKKQGFIAKYIGEARTKANDYEASVMLNLFPINALEGNVLSNYNIVTVQSHTMGEVKFYGQGAGKLPTANAIIQDILDIQEKISFNPISIEKKYIYSSNLFKHKYVIRSNEELKGDFEKIDKDGNNFYHYTKEITQADLLKLVDGKVKVEVESTDIEVVLKKYLDVDKIEFIREGKGGLLDTHREQWSDGYNTLAIAPREAIVYDRNTITNQLLEEKGVKLHKIDSGELSRGRGGPRCMSMPLFRENL